MTLQKWSPGQRTPTRLAVRTLGSVEGPNTKKFSDALTEAGIHMYTLSRRVLSMNGSRGAVCLNDFAPKLFR